MQATILNLEGRERQRLSQIGSLSDFTYTAGGTVDPQQILENPDINLYCLDHPKQQAIFAELPPGIDLSQAPFYYQAQFDNTQRLIAVPYDVLHQLADRIRLDPSRLIFIHNIGRCGSTLLSTAFNQVDTLMSFSEPDVFSNFALLRYNQKPDLLKLLHSCLRMTFRPVVAGHRSIFSLKLRNQCVDVMDLYHEAFPQAKHLFLYRNGLSWVASLYRLASRRSPRPAMSRSEALTMQAAYHNRQPSAVERFFDPTVETYSVETYLATGWLLMMDRYLELFSEGITPFAVRYEDLNAQPERVLTAIFDYCGLSKAGVTQALQAFERDSQQNTALARDDAQSSNTVNLPDDLTMQIRAIVSRHPVIQRPDFRLPGTLILD